jgi:AmmeMemoRadiSam system protein B
MKKAHFVILIVLSVLFLGATVSATTMRPPAVAGTFYPADSAELRAMIEQYLGDVTDLPEIDGQVIALIVPHAGLVYSGKVAAYAYKLLEGSGIDRAIICGPSHHFAFNGLSVYGPRIDWKTPLGNVSCPDNLCMQMIDFDKVRIGSIRAAHAE